MGANWENAVRGTDFQNFHLSEWSRKVSTPPPFRQALSSSYKRTGCATTPRLNVSAALLHITGCLAATVTKGNSWDGCGPRPRTPLAFLRSVRSRKTVVMEQNMFYVQMRVVILGAFVSPTGIKVIIIHKKLQSCRGKKSPEC